MATDHSLIYKICNLKVNVGLGQPLLYKRSKHGLGLLKFSRVPSLFRQSQKDLMGFIAVTFTFVLDFKQNNFYGDERHSVGSKLKTTNPVLKTNSVNSIHYQWHSWVNFILTLHSLATRGCSVFVIASTKLAGLAHAISWRTSTGTYLYWKVLIQLLTRPNLRDITLPVNVDNLNTALLLLRPITSYTSYTLFKKLRVPILGFSGTLATDRLLWQNANLFSFDLSVQYAIIVAYWALMRHHVNQ